MGINVQPEIDTSTLPHNVYYYKDRKHKPFRARITVHSQRICLGYYKTPEEASEAVEEAGRYYAGKDPQGQSYDNGKDHKGKWRRGVSGNPRGGSRNLESVLTLRKKLTPLRG